MSANIRSGKLLFTLLLTSLFCIVFPNRIFAASSNITIEHDHEAIGVLSPDIPSLSAIALSDLGSDNVQEILVASGYGSPTIVSVLRKDGSHIGSFFPYDEHFSGGASLTTCDIDGDGFQEIITGAGFSGGPQVRIFTRYGIPTGKQFFAYNETFFGGIDVLCKNIIGDATPEIITLPGPTGGGHLRIFSPNGELLQESMLTQKTSGLMFLNQDPTRIVEASFSEDPHLWHVSYSNSGITSTSEPYIQQSLNSLSTQGTDTEGTIVLTAQKTLALSEHVDSQFIQVDLSDQKLTAYEFGVPVFSFLVSTGVASHPTPLGLTAITDKLPIHDYSWFYGVGDARNYSLPNVKWNLRFRPHYYIHSAYWHNNFGKPMSHGCVNTSIPDGEKIFSWANVGTQVEIVE